MNRRRARQRRANPVRRGGLLGAWTIQRASGTGIVAGIAALLVVSLLDTAADRLLYPYALLLVLTAWCGASIFWITIFDMRRRGTSGRMRPIRTIDIAVALALLLPALYALALIRPSLGL